MKIMIEHIGHVAFIASVMRLHNSSKQIMNYLFSNISPEKENFFLYFYSSHEGNVPNTVAVSHKRTHGIKVITSLVFNFPSSALRNLHSVQFQHGAAVTSPDQFTPLLLRPTQQAMRPG